jgi:hypothetical protein
MKQTDGWTDRQKDGQAGEDMESVFKAVFPLARLSAITPATPASPMEAKASN